MRDLRRFCFFALALCLVGGCGSSGGGDDSTSETQVSELSSSLRENESTFVNSCGFVIAGETTEAGTPLTLENPGAAALSETGTLTGIESGNPVVVSFAGGPQAIKLLGIPVIEEGRKAAAVRALRPFLGQQVYVFRGAGCSVTFDTGGIGATSQVVTAAAGTDLAEVVLASGSVRRSDDGSCGEGMLKACHDGIIETSAPKVGAAVTDFLWKPQAESSFNSGLLVIHASPGPAKVFVNGRELPDFGPGNGRDLTARDIVNTGCDYKNAVVTILDSEGLPLVWPDGTTEFVIPDGCQRTEFKL